MVRSQQTNQAAGQMIEQVTNTVNPVKLRLANCLTVLATLGTPIGFISLCDAIAQSAIASTSAPNSVSIAASAIESSLDRSLTADSRPSHQLKSTTADAFYNQARQELPEDVYTIYRITERIARANGLDERPWRVGIVPEYDINAFATDVNLVALYAGLLDQLHGDVDALACVIAHEMGHNVAKHIAVGEAEQARILEELQAEAEAEAMAEAEDAGRDATGAGIGGAIARGVGGLLGGIGGLIGGTAGAVLDNEGNQRISRAEQRIQEIYEAKAAEVQQQWTELNHNQEFEADEYGYRYAATAGFDPAGCLRVMDVLNSLSQVESDTHPATPDRIARIQAMSRQFPAATLAAEGKTKLATNANPLTYDLSRDGQSLRINSRSGGQDIDDLLPQ